MQGFFFSILPLRTRRIADLNTDVTLRAGQLITAPQHYWIIRKYFNYTQNF